MKWKNVRTPCSVLSMTVEPLFFLNCGYNPQRLVKKTYRKGFLLRQPKNGHIQISNKIDKDLLEGREERSFPSSTWEFSDCQ